MFSFTLILLAFLIGLGAGAAVFARLEPAHAASGPLARRRCTSRPPSRSASTYLFTDKVPYVFTWLLQSSSFGVDAILFCQFVLACITVLPATLLMGGVFPLTVRVATGGLDSVGHDVGNAYALNTVGAIVGSFLSGFVVLPRLGLREGHLRRRAVRPGAGGDAVLRSAPAAAAPPPPGGRRRRRRAGAAGPGDPALGPGQLLVGLLPRLDRARVHLPQDPQARLGDARAGVLRGRHGHHASASISWDKTYSLKNNGKVDASNDADMPTQIIVGLLPFLFYSQPHAAQGARWSATARA